MLGAWMQPGGAPVVPGAVFSDLQLRGVEGFRVLAGCAAASDASDMLLDIVAEVPGLRIIPLQGRELGNSSSLLCLRLATRRAVLSGDELVQRIQGWLTSEMARRATFVDEREGLAFIADLLMRTDRRLYQWPAVGSHRCAGHIAADLSAAHC